MITDTSRMPKYKIGKKQGEKKERLSKEGIIAITFLKSVFFLPRSCQEEVNFLPKREKELG